jgi:hypothetical protein
VGDKSFQATVALGSGLTAVLFPIPHSALALPHILDAVDPVLVVSSVRELVGDRRRLCLAGACGPLAVKGRVCCRGQKIENNVRDVDTEPG